MLAYETKALATEAETKAFSVKTKAKTKAFSVKIEAFEISTEARPSRGTTAPRDGLETEGSRPRPHPCWLVNCCRCMCYSIVVKVLMSLQLYWVSLLMLLRTVLSHIRCLMLYQLEAFCTVVCPKPTELKLLCHTSAFWHEHKDISISWWWWTLAACMDKLTAQVSWLSPRVGGCLAPFCINQVNWVSSTASQTLNCWFITILLSGLA